MVNPDPSSAISGEVVYLYAFDVAFEMRRVQIDRLLGQELTPAPVSGDKRKPRRLGRERPLLAKLPVIHREGRHGTLRIEPLLKVYRIGAISITLRIPVTATLLLELIAYHEVPLAQGTIDDLARSLALQAHGELMPYWVRPQVQLPPEEAFTVFCITSPIADTAAWLQEHRREVAALLTQEEDAARLSSEEVEESTRSSLSYYCHDLLVMDWDAALLIDQVKGLEETIEIIELANLELAELEAYDLVLDGVVERAFQDVNSPWWWQRGRVLRELGELRIDIARTNDALGNITKFFGEWHLARVYAALSERFHLSDWQKTIDAKLRTLDDRYQLLKQDQTNRLMLLLEILVVVLFIIDLVLLVLH